MKLWHTPDPVLLNGRNISYLLQREYWRDVGSPWPFLWRCHYEAMREWLKREQVNVVIWPYENQPLEKLTILACQQHDRTQPVQPYTRWQRACSLTGYLLLVLLTAPVSFLGLLPERTMKRIYRWMGG